MPNIIYPQDRAWYDSRVTVQFDGVPTSTHSAEWLWDAVVQSDRVVANNPAASVGVAMYARTDDEGRRWYAVLGPAGARGVSSSATQARAMAFRFALGTVSPAPVEMSDEPEPCKVEEDRNEEYRDPMEEPGAWACGDCGLYPLAASEQHNCL